MLLPKRNIYLSLCGILAILTLDRKIASAKGLEDLTPKVESEVPKKGDAVKEEGNQKLEEKKAKETEKVQQKIEEKTKKPEEVKEEAKIEPSEISKSLADKLFLATGFGLASIKGKDGTWSGRGNGEVEAGFMLSDTLVPNVKLYGSYRYAAIDTTVVSDKKQSYRGIVEIHHFGALGGFPLKDKLYGVASAAVGLVSTHLKSVDYLPEESSLSGTGVMLSLGGGIDYYFFEKLIIAPRLQLGFGKFQIIGLTAAAKFLF